MGGLGSGKAEIALLGASVGPLCDYWLLYSMRRAKLCRDDTDTVPILLLFTTRARERVNDVQTGFVAPVSSLPFSSSPVSSLPSSVTAHAPGRLPTRAAGEVFLSKCHPSS